LVAALVSTPAESKNVPVDARVKVMMSLKFLVTSAIIFSSR
jgi:hypothetical protein